MNYDLQRHLHKTKALPNISQKHSPHTFTRIRQFIIWISPCWIPTRTNLLRTIVRIQLSNFVAYV